MTTKWDDDRIIARVEARVDGTGPGQKQIAEGQGYVVRLYDKGPPDGRTNDPLLVFDSEVTHGSEGVFGVEHEAAEYMGRRAAAQLAASRVREELGEERRLQLPELGHECIEIELKEKAVAKVANERAKAAAMRHKELTEDARTPRVLVECPCRGSGWTVQAAPCETEPAGPEPRVLAQVLPDEAKAPKKRGKRRSSKKPKAIPSGIEASLDATVAAMAPANVPDCAGLPLAVGSRVLHVVEEMKGEVLGILTQDTSGVWTIEVQFDEQDGPVVGLSTEFEWLRATDEGWPDEGPA